MQREVTAELMQYFASSLYHIIKKLTYFIEVERELPRYAAVEPGLEVSGPVLAEYVLAARVALAHAGHARVHRLPAVDVLHRGLAEEEQHVFTHVEGTHEVWLWRQN